MTNDFLNAEGSRVAVRQLHAGAQLSDMLGRQHHPISNLKVLGFVLLIVLLYLIVDCYLEAFSQRCTYFYYYYYSTSYCRHLPS